MMTPIKKTGPKKYKTLKEDIFNHLDSVYRSARRLKNFTAALKAVELCLKAKQINSNKQTPLLHLQDMSEEALEQMLQQLDSEESNENSILDKEE